MHNKPTDGKIAEGHKLREYFQLQAFPTTSEPPTIDDALLKTAIWGRSKFFLGIPLFEELVDESIKASQLTGMSSATELFLFRLNEQFVRAEICNNKQRDCDFSDVNVQTSCATLHLSGERISRNAARASEWLRMAAEQGSVFALLSLSHLYLEGNGIPADVPQALALLENASSLGDNESNAVLAHLYMEGVKVPHDYEAAHRWAKLAALRGSSFAQAMMGKLYVEGLGVKKDPTEGAAWFSLSAWGGNAKSKQKLNDLAEQSGSEFMNTVRIRANELASERWEEVK